MFVNLENTLPHKGTFDRTAIFPCVADLVERRRNQPLCGSGFILGRPACGKTTAAELQIRSILRDSEEDVIVIDTTGAYVTLAKELGGQVIRLPLGGSARLNPFDISPSGIEPSETIEVKTEFLLAWMEILLGGKCGLSAFQKNIVVRAVKKVYDPYFNYKSKVTNAYDTGLLPTLRDLYRILRGQKLVDAQAMADSLEIFISGSVDLFGYLTNIHHNNQLIVYDLHDCRSNFGGACLLAVYDHIYSRYLMAHSEESGHSWLFVDDIHRLLSRESASHYFSAVYNALSNCSCTVTGITQHADLFLSPGSSLGSVLSGSSYIHIMCQSPADNKHLCSFLSLPAEAHPHMQDLTTGQALVFEGLQFLTISNNYSEYKLYFPAHDTGLWQGKEILQPAPESNTEGVFQL